MEMRSELEIGEYDFLSLEKVKVDELRGRLSVVLTNSGMEKKAWMLAFDCVRWNT